MLKSAGGSEDQVHLENALVACRYHRFENAYMEKVLWFDSFYALLIYEGSFTASGTPPRPCGPSLRSWRAFYPHQTCHLQL